MTTALGQGAYIGIGESTAAWGTAATRTAWFEATGDTDGMKTEVDKIKSASIFRETVNTADVYKGNIRAQGTLTHELRFAGWTRWLKWLLAHVPTPSGSGTYTSVFEPQSDLSALSGQSGLSVEVFRGNVEAGGGGANESFLYSGCMVRGVTFNFERGQPVTIEVDLIAQNTTLVAKSTPSFDASNLVIAPSPAASPSHFLTWNSLTPLIRSGSISIKRGLDEERYRIQSQTMSQPLPSDAYEITGSFEMEFEDSTMWDDFYAATRRTLAVVIEGPTAASESITFTLRNCTIEGEPQVSGRGPVLVTYEFMAHHDGSNKAVSITVINSESAIQ
jgi:hypothetical protein